MSQHCVDSPGPSKVKSVVRELSGSWEAECQMLISKEALRLDYLSSVPGSTTCCVTMSRLPNFYAPVCPSVKLYLSHKVVTFEIDVKAFSTLPSSW